MKLTTRDKRVYHSGTAEQMVGLLWKDAFIQDTTPGSYMKAVASRADLWDGAVLCTETARAFLEDLAAAGHVTIDWRPEV